MNQGLTINQFCWYKRSRYVDNSWYCTTNTTYYRSGTGGRSCV